MAFEGVTAQGKEARIGTDLGLGYPQQVGPDRDDRSFHGVPGRDVLPGIGEDRIGKPLSVDLAGDGQRHGLEDLKQVGNQPWILPVDPKRAISLQRRLDHWASVQTER